MVLPELLSTQLTPGKGPLAHKADKNNYNVSLWIRYDSWRQETFSLTALNNELLVGELTVHQVGQEIFRSY
jgi:hypothetical protein